MGIEWNPSHGATLGVEWEVQLIDSETRMLRQEADKLLDDLPVIGDTGRAPADTLRADAVPTLKSSPAFSRHVSKLQVGPRQNDQ